MCKWMMLLVMMLPAFALASTNGYHLKIELSKNGKPFSSPRVLVREGETASITQMSDGEQTFMDVVATEMASGRPHVILIKVELGTISPSGEKTNITRSQIVTMENQKAQIRMGDQDGSEDLSISVVAVRKSL